MNHRRRLAVLAVMVPLVVAAQRASPQMGRLGPGSDPSVLPGPVLIADRGNDRLVLVNPEGRVLWTFPEPGDLAPGERFKVSDDAFYTPDGKQIIVTHEDDFTVTLVDPVSRRIVWRYGTPGVHGHGQNQLWSPDDALVLPDGHTGAGHQELPHPAHREGRAGTRAHLRGEPTAARRLRARSPADLREPERRLPDAERSLPGHRDQGSMDRAQS